MPYRAKPPRAARRRRTETPPARRSIPASADLPTLARAGRAVIVDRGDRPAGVVLGAGLESVGRGIRECGATGDGEAGARRSDEQGAGETRVKIHGWDSW